VKEVNKERCKERAVKRGDGERRGVKKAGAIFGAHVTTGSRWAGLVAKGKRGGPTPILLRDGKIVL
jgi:hypothetical protein